MSIAEQIMLGTQQQSKNWSVLSDSIGQLGQQIGQSLANKEYQNQVQAVLPMMQATYRNAFDKIGQGNLSEGYSDLMDAQLQYGSSTNPFIQNMNKQMAEMSKQYANDYLAQERLRVTEAMYGQRYGNNRLPATDASRYGFGNISSVDNQNVTPLPKNPNFNQPVDEIPQTTGTTGVNEPIQEGTPAQIAGKQNFNDLVSLPQEEQQAAAMSYGVTDINPDQYEVVNIQGLNKYLKDFQGFGVPKETWKETTASLSGKNELSRQSKLTAPEARENFLNDGGTKANLEKAVKTMGDKTMTLLFNDYGQDIYSLRAATDAKVDSRNQPVFTVTTKDGKDKRITQDQYLAIQTIAGVVPGTAENAGGTPAIFKPRKKDPKELIAMARQELGANATREQIIIRARQLANK